MSTLEQSIASLLSDEVFSEGTLASDVRSLWRRLARTQEVIGLARQLASDRNQIESLCSSVQVWLDEPYDRSYRHPKDIAICAALIALETSPLSAVRHLFTRLRGAKVPSLVWIKRMAEHCETRIADSAYSSYRISPDSALQSACSQHQFEALGTSDSTWTLEGAVLDRSETPSTRMAGEILYA